MMKNTTLCYLEKNDRYLMLHRTKKENDENRDKWIGIGGKLEEGETPYECARREIYEETGLITDTLFYRGIITFVSDLYGTEYMHLFTCTGFYGEITANCDEGELVWVDKNEVENLSIWQGDKIFLRLLDTEERFFSLKLEYRKDELVSHKIEYR
jgi:8-oxo-dGTP diphosphatase